MQSTGTVVFGQASPGLIWTEMLQPSTMSSRRFVPPQSIAPVWLPPMNLRSFVGSVASAAIFKLPKTPIPRQIVAVLPNANELVGAAGSAQGRLAELPVRRA